MDACTMTSAKWSYRFVYFYVLLVVGLWVSVGPHAEWGPALVHCSQPSSKTPQAQGCLPWVAVYWNIRSYVGDLVLPNGVKLIILTLRLLQLLLQSSRPLTLLWFP